MPGPRAGLKVLYAERNVRSASDLRFPGRKVSAETFPAHSAGALRAAYTLADRARIALGPQPAVAGNPASGIRDNPVLFTVIIEARLLPERVQLLAGLCQVLHGAARFGIDDKARTFL